MTAQPHDYHELDTQRRLRHRPAPSGTLRTSTATKGTSQPTTSPGGDDGAAADLTQLRRSVRLAKVGREHVWRVDETATVLLFADLAVAVAVILVGAQGSATLAVTFAVSFLAVRLASGTTRHRLHLSVVDALPSDVVTSSAALGAGVVIVMAVGDWTLVARFVWMTLVALVLVVLARTVAFAVLRRRRRSIGGRRRTLIVGAGPVGRNIAEGLIDRPQFGLHPVGFIDTERAAAGRTLPVPLLSRQTAKLGDVIAAHDIRTVVVAFVADDEDLVDVMLTSTRRNTDILVVPRLYELASDDARTDWINGVPLVRHTSGVTTRVSWRVKRMIDCTVAAVSLLLLSPILLVAAVAVLVDSGRPILFRQHRVGVDGVTFELLKFRSMRPVDENEQQTTWTIAGDPRIGRVGNFLRRSSIDELPQLLNILRGEMSLVGPRPERPTFVAQFSVEHSRYWARHRLPVGLTGWAQVNGLRGDTSIARRARFDNFYIANWSLWLDLKIMILTLREVLRGSGK